MLDRLEGSDDPAKLFAVGGVINRLAQHFFARAQAVGGQYHPAGVDHCLQHAFALAQWFSRGVGKIQLANCASAVDSVQRYILQPGGIGPDQIQTAALVGEHIALGTRAIENK